MTPTARLAAALAWALEQLPEDPPRSSDSGWCPRDTAEWRRRRAEAEEVLARVRRRKKR